MHISSNVKELLLEPMLGASLDKPVFKFVLNSLQGPKEFSAFLTRSQPNRGFKLTLHDPESKGFDGLFTKKRKITPNDAVLATGLVDGRIKVEFQQLYSPNTSKHINSDASHLSGELNFQRIEIPPSGSDNQTYDEIIAHLDALNGKPPKEKPDNSEKPPEYEHLVIVPSTKLYYGNSQIDSVIKHPFWGHWTECQGTVYGGEIWDGEYSIRQYGDHLMIGLKHADTCPVTAQAKMRALYEAVAYSHAFQPWPAFRLTRQDGKVTTQSLYAGSHKQGSMRPLNSQDWAGNQKCPHRLISSVAECFHSLPDEKIESIRQALWIFRSADNKEAPLPLQQAMICGVVESLLGVVKPHSESVDEPPEFTEIKKEMMRWPEESKERFSSETYQQHLNGLKQFLGQWKYDHETQKQLWMNAFGPLFPKNEKYVESQRKNFQDLRHSVAHGNYALKTDCPHEPMDKIGQMAAFINVIIAAKAGYVGTIRSNVWGDERITLHAPLNL
ncbi:MAG: hypothetical protein ACSHX0_13240 [Akkermansiaceae bacterium]